MKQINIQIGANLGRLHDDDKDLRKALDAEKLKSGMLGKQLVEATLELATEKQKSQMLGMQLTQGIFDASIEKNKTLEVGKQITELRLQLLEKGVL